MAIDACPKDGIPKMKGMALSLNDGVMISGCTNRTRSVPAVTSPLYDLEGFQISKPL